MFESVVAVQPPALSLLVSGWHQCLVSRIPHHCSTPLCGAVSGVHPKLSHQHPHCLLSLQDAKRMREWEVRTGGGGEAEREAGCGRGGCLLWTLISLLRVWQGAADDSTRDIFYISRYFPGKSVFKHVYVWLTLKMKSLQTNNMAICSSGIPGFHFFHCFSHHRMVMTDCVMVIEPGCGWWVGYQQSQLETPQLLDWLQCLKEDPDEETMSLFHSWVEGMRAPC